ncbi:MAG TPA: hypothetical protein VD931_20935 [Baekduia sp.]|nr:hypothetical protein [Baekduia sp.]
MLLAHGHQLPDGPRVRLRLARSSDRPALGELARRTGRPCSELELQRMVRVRPRARVAICATAWVDGHEAVVGYAAGDLAAGAPDVVLADEGLAPGVTDVLAAAVAERAGLQPRTVA